MNESAGYAVFFHSNALETLGEAIKPYLQDGPAGPHVPCVEVDTAGAFIELTLEGRDDNGREVALELMVPGNMVRMIVSARSDGDFGFYNRSKPTPAMIEPGLPADAPAATEADVEAVPAAEAKPGA